MDEDLRTAPALQAVIDGRSLDPFAVLGRHRGIAHYTVAQSKRLGLPGVDARMSSDRGQRLAVVALDAATRRVVVAPRDRGTTEVRLRAVN